MLFTTACTADTCKAYNLRVSFSLFIHWRSSKKSLYSRPTGYSTVHKVIVSALEQWIACSRQDPVIPAGSQGYSILNPESWDS